MSTAAPQRYENIDALRAIAAMLVVVQHFFGDVVREAQNLQGPLVQLVQISLSSVDLGRFGVVLFFLISGFVVPFSIRGARPLRRFAISRFFRIYPALWLAVLVLSVIFTYRGEAPSVATVLANMTMFPNFVGFKWLSGIYWTLTIELIFYMLCAALFWQASLYRPWIITAFALLLIASTALPIVARILLGLHLPIQYIGLHVSFLYCGLLLRLAMVEKHKGAWAGAGIVALTQFVVLFWIGDFSLARSDGFFLVGKAPIIAAYFLAFAVFICAVYSGKPTSPILSFGGTISYSVYLFHGVAALLTYALFPLTGGWNDLWIGCISLTLTMLISWSVYTCLETPMISLGRKLMSRPNRQVAAVG
jgi:peptidoglycan/LPS O-acetylase OafA/YrhL